MSLPKEKRYLIKVDFITANMVTLAIFVLCLGITWDDKVSVYGAIFLAVGLSACVFFKTTTWDLMLNRRERFQIALWTLIDMGVVLIINFSVQKGPSPFQSLFLIGNFAGLIIGVAEEVLFGMYGTGWIWRQTRGNTPATLFTISMIFLAFHFFVYGTNPKALIIVFGGRMVLSASIIDTKRATSATVSHGLINFLSRTAQVVR